jgi:hypothetical protein
VKDRKQGSVLLAVIAMSVFAAVALWQFYVFVTFSRVDGTLDPQGGRQHLWWSLAAGAIACIAGFFVFSRLVRYDRGSEMHITSPPGSRMVL